MPTPTVARLAVGSARSSARRPPSPVRTAEARGEKIVEKLVSLALGGNLKAIGMLFDRCDGKPREAAPKHYRDDPDNPWEGILG